MPDRDDARRPTLHIPEPDRGDQARPMTEEEELDASLEDSMDASDPPEIVQPHRHDDRDDKAG